MRILKLKINQLRNLTDVDFQAHPQFNFIIGENGSGKTSLLEAIYLLGAGHSFRTRENTPLINHESASLQVFGRLSNKDTLGIEKTRLGKTRVKLNGSFCTKSSALAHKIPMLVIYQDIYNIIDAGPTLRRAILDWGLFHVKHDYLPLWQQYKRILKQRNSVLRNNGSENELSSWDSLLSNAAERLDSERAAYIKTLTPRFLDILRQLLDLPVIIQYDRGWGLRYSSFLNSLQTNRALERKRQITLNGPHHADIKIKLDGKKIKNNLSRGQQKLILIALRLSQTQIMETPCVYLIDDIAAELDSNNRKRVARLIMQLPGQFFFTGVDSHDLNAFMSIIPKEMFHVKHLS